MSIFKDLHDASAMAWQLGDRDHARALDRANVLVGEVMRELNVTMTPEAFQIAVAAWTQAMLLMGEKPARAA